MTEQIPAVILAGGKAKPDLEALTGQRSRALVKVNGRTLLDCAVDAVIASGDCSSVVVVGDMPPSDRYRVIPDAGDIVGNVFAGVTAAGDARYTVIVTSDLPFLDGPAVDLFITRAMEVAERTNAALVYPVIPVASCYARFPGVKRTSLKIREGEFTGGNLMLVRPSAMPQIRTPLAEAYAARKSVTRLGMMLGPGIAARLFITLLTKQPLLEGRVSRIIGGPASAVICDSPEIATDLDRASDFEAIGLSPGSNQP
jgi:molybdopterin-guanine dinucleotide biosynthesis protein A